MNKQDIIIKTLVERIKAGLMTIDEIPEIYKAKVQELLNIQLLRVAVIRAQD